MALVRTAAETVLLAVTIFATNAWIDEQSGTADDFHVPKLLAPCADVIWSHYEPQCTCLVPAPHTHGDVR